MSDDKRDYSKELQAPFEITDVEWKPQNLGFSGGVNPYILVVPYITNRAVQKRLDDVFGVEGWGNEFKEYLNGKGTMCGITAFIGERKITKWDGVENTAPNNIDVIKTASSNSMKRASVQFGIGRYLYDLPTFFPECIECEGKKHAYGNVSQHKKKNGNDWITRNIAWKTPELPAQYLPVKDIIPFVDAMKKAQNKHDLRMAFSRANNLARTNQDDRMGEKFLALNDKCTQELEVIAAQNAAKDMEELKAWATKQANTFKAIPTFEALEQVYSVLKGELTSKSLGKFVDTNALNLILDSEFENCKIDSLGE